MKAEPAAQRRLLDLAALDQAISQLQHRVSSLPEHALIQEGLSERSHLGQRLVARQTELSDAEAALAKAESDLVPVQERLARNQKRVDDGVVTDPKALSSMLDEIAHLKHRIEVLEDQQLECMQAAEDAGAAVAEVQAERGEIESTVKQHMAKRDAAVAELNADLAEREKERGDTAAAIDAPLVALYEKIRARGNGIGAAKLVGRRCSGCGLEATASDYDRYVAAAPDEVLRCEECDRILVRGE